MEVRTVHAIVLAQPASRDVDAARPRGVPGAVPGPVIILVEPQMPENIGMAARAMANFGLDALRLVAPREGWPNPVAEAAAVGATRILSGARLYGTTREAVADLQVVLATTARLRGQMKRVLGPEEALADLAGRIGAGQAAGILFGRERTGLENDDVSLADAAVTFPVDPAFPSMNLAQAVSLVGYEWRRAASRGEIRRDAAVAPPAERAAVAGLFDYMEDQLAEAGFYPPNKRSIMARNMRDMFHRMGLTDQDVRTWRGAIRALAEGRMRKA